MNHALSLIGTSERISWRAEWRARKLTRPRKRRRLAAGFERVIADAAAPPRVLTAAIPIQRDNVIAASADLLELADRLRAPGPVYAQGVAMAAELLQNAGSALYEPCADLRGAVRAALGALDGHIG
jgi:hypothetical protein